MKSKFDFRRYDACIDRAIQPVKDVPKVGDNYNIVRYAIKVYFRVVYDYFCSSSSLSEGQISHGLDALLRLFMDLGIVQYARFMKHMKAEFVRSDECTYALFRSATQLYFGVTESRSYLPFIRHLFTERGVIISHREFNVVLSYLTKLTLTNDAIVDQAIMDYRDLEANYPQGASIHDPLVKTMQKYASNWLRDFPVSVDDFHFSHGSGSTAVKATGTSISLKTNEMWFDPLLLKTLCRSTNIDPLRFIPPSRRSERTFAQIRTSKLTTVPKSIEKRRTISMEHPMLMYFQQGIRKELYAYLEQPRFAKRINFTSVYYNNYAAWFGSKYPNTYATIDLSSASDLVSNKLVMSVFRNTPLLRWLVATRSTHTEVGGERIALHKFAPMGSALCFPIESLIFALACEATLDLSGASRPYSYKVYGDDICFPCTYIPELLTNLELLGFRVNMDKSFWTGPYRESCGKEYYRGLDITALYFRPASLYTSNSGVIRNRLTPQGYLHLVCKANEMKKIFFRSAHRYMVDTIYRCGPDAFGPLLSNETARTDALYSYKRNNTKWDRHLQCAFCMHTAVKTPIVQSALSDADAYFYTLYLNEFRDKYREPVMFNSGRQNLVFCKRRSSV